MQNPEVWSFHEPHSTFNIQELNTSDISIKHFQNFYFSHLVSVVIPDCLRVPDQLTNLLSDDCEYYKVLDLNLSDLLNPDFLNSFVKKGKFSLLSIGTRIDCDNCCAVTPTGCLILSLTKDTYQCVGLEGKPSHFTKRNKDRYKTLDTRYKDVEIDLKDPKLTPGKTHYDKTKSALDSLERFTVIVSWEPPEEHICPSSVAKFFDEINYNVKVCEPSFKSHVVYSVKTPTLDGTCIERNDIIDFVEWLGMASIDGDFTGDPDSYLNTYDVPEPNVELGQVRVLTWRGFYHSGQIMTMINFLRELNNVQEKIWLSMYVQGFSDAPVIENKEEQNYYTNGDNANIFIFKKSKCWFCKHRCSAKRYK